MAPINTNKNTNNNNDDTNATNNNNNRSSFNSHILYKNTSSIIKTKEANKETVIKSL